jgi:Asp-tRNA(Asn)/Glu-tRNA(Gln) amidotransferase A subunit family amidase
LFADDARTVRSDGGATLVGHQHIAAFRAGRPPVPSRRLERVHVRDVTEDAAVIVAEAVRDDGRTGVQTQLWTRDPAAPAGWVVSVAHVSNAPAPDRPTEPDHRTDPAIWRVKPQDGPLVRGAADGPLKGRSIAVKDLFAVAGQRIGGGNPYWLDAAPLEAEHAAAVASLLGAGADVAGIAHTDELAFSLAGTNIHYGTPANAAAPGRISGGSSSGPAAAVAAGIADIGLGTDTAGSIRVPASYCGLYGLRTTHGAVDRSGLLALAPSFDTVGVLTRTAKDLAAAAEVLLPPGEPTRTDEGLVAAALMELAAPDTRLATEAALRALVLRAGCRVRVIDLPPTDLRTWWQAFRTVQTAEAWHTHGEFVATHAGKLEPAIEARFRAGAGVSPTQEDDARTLLAGARTRLNALLPGGTVLALPSSSSPALVADADADDVEAARAATLQLTCLASLSGLPALSMPTPRVGTLPAGLCLVAGPGEDRSLLALTTQEAR